MRYRELGRTGLRVSIVGLGTGPLGGLYGRHIPDDTAIALVRRAIDLGINYIDTAPLYGHGRAEELVGRATEDMHDHFIVATKVGYLPADYDYSYDMTLRCVEDSLRRLRLPRLPLVQIHDVERSRMDVILGPHGALAALRKLQDQGVIGHVGVSGGPPDLLCRYVETGEFETVITHNRYTLLNSTAAERLVPLAVARGVGIINGGPYATGILATGAMPDAKFSYQTATPDVMERVVALEDVCHRHGVTLKMAALQFSLHNEQISVTVPGAASIQEVVENAAAVDADGRRFEPIFTVARAQPSIPYREPTS